MTAVIDSPETDAKAGFSSMCRRGDHAQCKTAQARCICDCHAAARRMLGRTPPPKPRTRTEPTPPQPPRSLIRKAGQKPPPVFELVKADPPAPPEKERRKTLTELVRPLLEEILVARDRDWYRVVLFHTARQASMNVKRCRDAYSKTEWEWRAVKLALYVRWVAEP